MKTDLIYGIEDRPPFKDALFAALQHLLAIFVAIITPPLIIASALKLDVEKTGFLVSMSLLLRECLLLSSADVLPYRGETALYTRHELFVYWSDHCYGACRRTSSYFWCLYGGSSH